MKLSVRGEYALRAMQVLARDFQEDDSVVRIQEISEKQNIPKRFLEQILNDLKSAGVVPSTSEALRMIEQGGVKVDGQKVFDKALKLAVGGPYVLQVGKRKFAKVTLRVSD